LVEKIDNTDIYYTAILSNWRSGNDYEHCFDKTERSLEAPIKISATKDDITSIRAAIVNIKEEIAILRYDILKEIGEHKADTIKWMFNFWIGRGAAALAVILVFIKNQTSNSKASLPLPAKPFH
jgi:hypothetical protein